MQKLKHFSLFKACAIGVLITFFSSTLAWSYPDVMSKSETLAADVVFQAEPLDPAGAGFRNAVLEDARLSLAVAAIARLLDRDIPAKYFAKCLSEEIPLVPEGIDLSRVILEGGIITISWHPPEGVRGLIRIARKGTAQAVSLRGKDWPVVSEGYVIKFIPETEEGEDPAAAEERPIANNTGLLPDHRLVNALINEIFVRDASTGAANGNGSSMIVEERQPDAGNSVFYLGVHGEENSFLELYNNLPWKNKVNVFNWFREQCIKAGIKGTAIDNFFASQLNRLGRVSAHAGIVSGNIYVVSGARKMDSRARNRLLKHEQAEIEYHRRQAGLYSSEGDLAEARRIIDEYRSRDDYNKIAAEAHDHAQNIYPVWQGGSELVPDRGIIPAIYEVPVVEIRPALPAAGRGGHAFKPNDALFAGVFTAVLSVGAFVLMFTLLNINLYAYPTVSALLGTVAVYLLGAAWNYILLFKKAGEALKDEGVLDHEIGTTVIADTHGYRHPAVGRIPEVWAHEEFKTHFAGMLVFLPLVAKFIAFFSQKSPRPDQPYEGQTGTAIFIHNGVTAGRKKFPADIRERVALLLPPERYRHGERILSALPIIKKDVKFHERGLNIVGWVSYPKSKYGPDWDLEHEDVYEQITRWSKEIDYSMMRRLVFRHPAVFSKLVHTLYERETETDEPAGITPADMWLTENNRLSTTRSDRLRSTITRLCQTKGDKSVTYENAAKLLLCDLTERHTGMRAAAQLVERDPELFMGLVEARKRTYLTDRIDELLEGLINWTPKGGPHPRSVSPPLETLLIRLRNVHIEAYPEDPLGLAYYISRLGEKVIPRNEALRFNLEHMLVLAKHIAETFDMCWKRCGEDDDKVRPLKGALLEFLGYVYKLKKLMDEGGIEGLEGLTPVGLSFDEKRLMILEIMALIIPRYTEEALKDEGVAVALEVLRERFQVKDENRIKELLFYLAVIFRHGGEYIDLADRDFRQSLRNTEPGERRRILKQRVRGAIEKAARKPEGGVVERVEDLDLQWLRRFALDPGGYGEGSDRHYFKARNALRWGAAMIAIDIIIVAVLLSGHLQEAVFVPFVSSTPLGSLFLMVLPFITYFAVAALRYYDLARAACAVLSGREGNPLDTEIGDSTGFRHKVLDEGRDDPRTAHLNRLVNIHEGYRTHFWGMIGLLPLLETVYRAVVCPVFGVESHEERGRRISAGHFEQEILKRQQQDSGSSDGSSAAGGGGGRGVTGTLPSTPADPARKESPDGIRSVQETRSTESRAFLEDVHRILPDIPDDIDQKPSAEAVEIILGRLAQSRVGNEAPEESLKGIEEGIDAFVAERITGEILVLARRAGRQDQKLIIGFETGWIPGMAKQDRSFQKIAISPLIREVEDIQRKLRGMGIDNVVFIHEDGRNLANSIRTSMNETGTRPGNVVVLASCEALSLAQGNFDDIRGEGKDRAFIAEVDPRELKSSYEKHENSGGAHNRQLHIRLTEMLCLTLELASGKELTGELSWVEVSLDRENRTAIFIPRAEQVDFDQLKKIYKQKLKALRAA